MFLRCCTAYRGSLHAARRDDLVTLQPRLEIAVLAPGGRRGWLRRSALPAPLHLAGSLARYPFLTSASVSRWPRRCSGCGPSISTTPPTTALVRRLAAPRRQDRRAIDAIWELIVRPTINLTVDDASLAQAAQVFRLGLLEQTDAGDIG